jgi:hypothetical protein
MADVGDDARALSDYIQEQHAKRREEGPGALEAAGHKVSVHNRGAHLVVNESVDFWPGTGRWIARSTGRRGRGIDSLLGWLLKKDHG